MNRPRTVVEVGNGTIHVQVKKHGIAFHEKHKGQLFCDRSAEDLIAMLLAECAAGGVERWQPCGVKNIRFLASSPYGSCASSYEKRSINALRFVKAPHPRTDARRRAERRPGQKLPLMRLHALRLATVATAFGDGAFKDPGVAALQRALFAGA